MGKLGWIFEKQGVGPEQGINDSGIATFKGSELYEYVARENGQNSLDAKDPNKDHVRLAFNLVSLPVSGYPELSGLKDIIEECGDYWKNREDTRCDAFFKEAQRTIDKETVDLLIISDYNTVGASGANNERHSKSKWRALTSSNGVTENRQGSGGAYGIGKNAPFACSVFRTVFYNTVSQEDNISAFQGTTKLVTHTHDGEDVQGFGFCWNLDNNKPVMEHGLSPLMDYLNRTEFGTDVIIAGFKKTDNWEEAIERAIISNFLIAIANGTLEIEISGHLLNKRNLKDRIDYYVEKEKDLPQKYRKITPISEFYMAFCEADYVLHGSILEDGDATLYIKKNDSYSKTIAETRAIGMIVRTRSKNIYSRYAAVLVVKPGKLNNLLKEIEPPTHDKWDPGIIEDEVLRAHAEKTRSKLINWVNTEIIDNCKEELSEELDLEGISAFLPYDEDDPALGGVEDDSSGGDLENASNDLDSDLRPGEIKTIRNRRRSIQVSAQRVKGTRDEDLDPHNFTKGGKGRGYGGHEDPEGEDDVTVPKPGNRGLNVPNVLIQRISGTPQDGTYVLLFKLEKDCDNLSLSLKALGDDNNKEPLVIQSFRVDQGSNITVNDKAMHLQNVEADRLYKVFVTLSYKERLALEMDIR